MHSGAETCTIFHAATLAPEPRSDALVEETREDLGIPAVQTIQDPEVVAATLADLPGLAGEVGQAFYEPHADSGYFVALARSLPEQAELIDGSADFDRTVLRQQAAAADDFLGLRGEARADTATPSEAATRLAVLSMLDPTPLVRVAAAGAVMRIEYGNPLAIAILDDAQQRKPDDVSLLAATIRAREAGRRWRRIGLESDPGPPLENPDSVVVHGTWARRRGRWWRPDGTFNQFLRKDSIFPKLYRGTDPFEWSGYYTWRTRLRVSPVDWNHDQAAGSFAWWTHCELSEPPDVIGHSWGASISMRMTQIKKHVRALVLLSPAVHESCLPNAANYEGALMVRMKNDLVLLADRSRPELLDGFPKLEKKILDRTGWLGHSGTHDPKNWRTNKLDAYVRDQWLPTL